MTQAPQSSVAITPETNGSSTLKTEFGSRGDSGANPTLTETDVINGIMGQGPNYTYNTNGVPIGAGIGFTVTGQGSGVTLASATWTGGTTYTSYFGSTPSSTPANSMTIGQQPATVVDTNFLNNTDSYSFIIDNVPRTYTVSVVVTYKDSMTGAAIGGGPFGASVTFTSYGPTGSLASTNQPAAGTPTWYPNGQVNIANNNVPAAVVAWQGANATPGTQITASVTASPKF